MEKDPLQPRRSTKSPGLTWGFWNLNPESFQHKTHDRFDIVWLLLWRIIPWWYLCMYDIFWKLKIWSIWIRCWAVASKQFQQLFLCALHCWLVHSGVWNIHLKETSAIFLFFSCCSNSPADDVYSLNDSQCKLQWCFKRWILHGLNQNLKGYQLVSNWGMPDSTPWGPNTIRDISHPSSQAWSGTWQSWATHTMNTFIHWICMGLFG